MPIGLGDIVGQIGTGDYRLVKGKDVDLTAATALSTLENADIFLVDEGAAGTQASTKYITASSMKTYMQSGLTSGAISSVTNATDNYIATFSGSNTLNGEQNLQFNGNQLDVRGDIWVRDENDNTDPGQLIFHKARSSSGGNLVGLDNDNIGLVKFQSYNETPAVKTFAEIVSQISDATPGQEAGRLEFKVAEYDGTLTTGIKIEGDTNANGEVDVTIGAGTACTTTINGVVNLPNAAAGSVSSGDHLGLDGSGNIVKTTGGSAGVTLSGSTANGVATYNTTNELSIESSLQFDGDQLLFSPTLGGATLKVRDITSGNAAGKSFRFTGSDAFGTDQIGGEIRLSSGRGTGDKGGGDIAFYASQIGQSSGSTSNLPRRMLHIAGATANVQIDNTNFPNAGFVGNNIGLVHDDALYLTPGDFNITSVSRSDGDVYTNDNGGSIRPNSATHNYHAFTYVPLGYKVTHVQVEGSGGTFDVYTGQWSNDGTQQEGSQTTIGSTLDLSSSPWTSIAGKYLVIKWDPALTTNELYGAKLTLTRV
tara:strand:- start:2526 stop:4136 length:1611 start_codon:yes stop_codon:yes gene_type:complete